MATCLRVWPAVGGGSAVGFGAGGVRENLEMERGKMLTGGHCGFGEIADVGCGDHVGNFLTEEVEVV